VTIQIDAISTPKGNVPTVNSLERVVNGLNILDSEISAATDEARKDVLIRIKDLEKEIMGVKKLISEMAISLEAATEKLSGVDPKLQKTFETVESQRMESAELARYIGAVTNNLRREFIDYINLLEKKLSEEIRKNSKGDFPELKNFSSKLDSVQSSSDKKIGESIRVGSETKKTVDGLREDLSDLVKFLGDTLAGFSRKIDDISNRITEPTKAVETLKEQVEKSRRVMNSKIRSPQGGAPEDSDEN
jgi:chromosome segregation ATPase